MMCLSKLVLQTTKSKHKQKEKITRTRARVNKTNTYISTSKEAVAQTNGLVPKRDTFTPHTTSTFQRPCAAHQHSDRPQTWLKHQALVVRPLPSESARCASRIALNNTKSNLGSFKALKARAGIPDAHKRHPQWGLVLPSHPCHVGGRPMSHIALQGPRAGARRSSNSSQLAAPERPKIGKNID